MHHRPITSATKNLQRIAVLTSGGETPGMNSAIRSVVRTASTLNIEVVGINRGYCGLLQQDFTPLSALSVSQIIQGGGSILRCGSCQEFYQQELRSLAGNILIEHQIEALIVVGGYGSLIGAKRLAEETGTCVVGIPGTIENDIPGCEDSIGFDTATNTAVEAIDKLQDTAFSHQRLFLVEVAGNDSGFVAAEVALSVGAELVIVPEHPIDIISVAEQLVDTHRNGLPGNRMVVLAEGSAQPKLMQLLVSTLKSLGEDPRICVLGHIQRGGAPTAHDRSLAASLGNAAVHLLAAGGDQSILALQNNKIVHLSFNAITDRTKPLPIESIELIQQLGR